MKKLLLFLTLFATSCITPEKVLKSPQDYFYLPGFPLDWDGEYPIEVWRATIKLNEPFTGLDGLEYTLLEVNEPRQDSLYILQVILMK